MSGGKYGRVSGAAVGGSTKYHRLPWAIDIARLWCFDSTRTEAEVLFFAGSGSEADRFSVHRWWSHELPNRSEDNFELLVISLF